MKLSLVTLSYLTLMVVYGKNKQSYSGEPPLKTSYDSPNRQLNQGKVTLSRKQSLSEQSKEPDIVHLSRRALPSDDAVKVGECFYTKDGILMRK